METLAFATVLSPEGAIEAEPVVVEVAGEAVRMILDDGTELTFVRDELLAALGSKASRRRRPGRSSRVGSDKYPSVVDRLAWPSSF